MIEITDNIDAVEWEVLAKKSANSSYFQTKECFDFFSSLPFMNTFVFGVKENNLLKGVISGYIIANGGFIKRFFSRRAIIHGGALLADNISENALELLLQTVKKELNKKAIYIEFRNNTSYEKYKILFEKNHFLYQPYLNYIVNTSSWEQVYQKISKSKKRQIKKSQSLGVRIIEAKSDTQITDFYSVLKKLYKNRVRKPLFPKIFFEKLVTLSNSKLFLATYKENVIGGIACVFSYDTVYEWFICGKDEQYKYLYPSVRVTFQGIEYATKKGYKKFDFMGAGKPNKYYGVRDFKEKFGGDLVEYGRFLCINNKILYKVGKMVVNLLGKRII